MNEKMNISDGASCTVERIRQPRDGLEPKGRVKWELFDKDGNKKASGEMDNLVVNQGKNHWLGVEFTGTTQVTTWYIGIINNAGFITLAATDVLGTSNWAEWSSYSGNRQSWGPGAPASQSITNGTPVSFTMTAAGTLNGIFVCSVATGTSGTLWGEASFGSTVPVNPGDVLKTTYTVNS